jgi:hypothetical protein
VHRRAAGAFRIDVHEVGPNRGMSSPLRGSAAPPSTRVSYSSTQDTSRGMSRKTNHSHRRSPKTAQVGHQRASAITRPTGVRRRERRLNPVENSNAGNSNLRPYSASHDVRLDWHVERFRRCGQHMNPCLSQGCDEQVFESPHRLKPPPSSQVGIERAPEARYPSSVVGIDDRFGIRAPRISAALRSVAATHAADGAQVNLPRPAH